MVIIGVQSTKKQECEWIYPLVNVYITMENVPTFSRKINYFYGSFSIAMLVYRRVRYPEKWGTHLSRKMVNQYETWWKKWGTNDEPNDAHRRFEWGSMMGDGMLKPKKWDHWANLGEVPLWTWAYLPGISSWVKMYYHNIVHPKSKRNTLRPTKG